MEATIGGIRNSFERISYPNDKVPLSIAHGEEPSRVLIGEEFCMWDVARKKIYIELVMSKLEGHGTTRNPKTFRFGEES